jgi:hypothetical protein
MSEAFAQIVLGVVVLLAIGAALFVGGMGGRDEGRLEIQTEAIERGYALHCPKDGRFAWIGECDE